MPSHLKVEFLANFLKGVTEHAMADIVHERSSKGDLGLMILHLHPVPLKMPLDDLHQSPRCVKGANTMGEPGMRRPWVNKIRKAQLLDTAEALKWNSLDHCPQRLLELVSIELDNVVKRITNTLWLGWHVLRPQRNTECPTQLIEPHTVNQDSPPRSRIASHHGEMAIDENPLREPLVSNMFAKPETLPVFAKCSHQGMSAYLIHLKQ